MSGGHQPLRIPVFDVCPYCQGTGRAGFFDCDRCEGRGLIEEFHTLDILVPAQLRQETLIPLSLRNLGIRKLYLNLSLRPSETVPLM